MPPAAIGAGGRVSDEAPAYGSIEKVLPIPFAKLSSGPCARHSMRVRDRLQRQPTKEDRSRQRTLRGQAAGSRKAGCRSGAPGPRLPASREEGPEAPASGHRTKANAGEFCAERQAQGGCRIQLFAERRDRPAHRIAQRKPRMSAITAKAKTRIESNAESIVLFPMASRNVITLETGRSGSS